MKTLAWWKPEEFKVDYLKSWGKSVLKEWIETGKLKTRTKEKPDKEKEKPKPKGSKYPPFRKPGGGSRVPRRPKPPKDVREKVDDGKEKDRGQLDVLRDRLAGLRRKLRNPRERGDQEIIDVEAWSESQERHERTESVEAGDHLDPFWSRVALPTEVKREALKDGTSRGRKRKRRSTTKKEKKRKGTTSQLLEVAERQQRRRSEEKNKKEKKRKSSGSKKVKELVELLGGKKKRKKKKDDSPDPSDSGSSSAEESEEETSSSESDMLAPLQKKSLKKPGAVLKMLTRHARQTLDQTSVVEVGDSQEVTGGVKMATYFNLLIRPYHPATSRDMKELHYLSICMDELRSGKLEALGDSLASRFLAVHSAVNEGGWRTAQHLERHPLEGAQSAPTPLLLQARRRSKLVAKSRGKDESEPGWKGYYNREWRRDSWEDPKGKSKGPKGKGKGRGRGGKGKQDGWQKWQYGGGDNDNWWDKNKEKPGKEDAKEKK